MKLTRRSEYALKALLVLAAHYEQKNAITLRHIAKAEKLPLKFLEQIMMLAKRGGFIKSAKGKLGGYALARPPKEITLAEVIRSVDGPLAPFATTAEMEKRIRRNDRYAGLYSVLLEVRNAISNVLDRKTLGDILDRSYDLAWSDPSTRMYYI